MSVEDVSTLGRRPRPELPQRRLQLTVVDSPDVGALGRVLVLDGQALTLGRNVKGEGAFADLRLSRQHLRIAPDATDRLQLEDLGTRNGSFLDGRPVLAPTLLLAHQVISIGDTLLVVDQAPRAEDLPGRYDVDAALPEIVGASLATLAIRRSVATVAAAPGFVLLTGPTGVGKEVVTRALHRLSGRPGPLLSLNCAAIPTEIAEAELFGARAGAYTGAVADRPGAFASAHGGTLFLDEVGELPAALQAKLLRVLEDGLVQPLGGGAPVSIDVRVVAATNASLAPDRFRSDLYARLAQYVLRIPPLSARRADILVLWDWFMAQELPGQARPRTPEFSEALLLHDWPLNVREIRGLVRLLATVGVPGTPLGLDELPEALQRPLLAREGAPPPVSSAPEDVGPGRTVIEDALTRASGNMTTVAAELGVHRQQLYRWIRRLRLDLAQFR